MSDAELRKYYEFFTSVWKFFKAHHSPKTDDEWEAAIKDGEKLANENPFKSETKHTYSDGEQMINNGAEIIIKVMGEIERLAQERDHGKV